MNDRVWTIDFNDGCGRCIDRVTVRKMESFIDGILSELMEGAFLADDAFAIGVACAIDALSRGAIDWNNPVKFVEDSFTAFWDEPINPENIVMKWCDRHYEAARKAGSDAPA